MDLLWKTLYSDFVVKGLLVTLVGGAVLASLSQSLVVMRTSMLVANGRRMMASAHPARVARGVHTLLEIARKQSTRRQEMVDIVTEMFRRRFPCGSAKPGPSEDLPTPAAMVALFTVALRALLSVPRRDDNGHEMNIDLHQIALVALPDQFISLEKLNLRDVVLWGSKFVRVGFSRSTFENADLGGVHFKNCGLEDIAMKNAKLSWSFIDERATTIEESQVARSSIDEAHILEATRTQLVVIRSEIDATRLDTLAKRKSAVQLR